MKNYLIVQVKFIALLIPLFWLNSCKTIAVFDQQAYFQTTTLKVEALKVMDKAVENYADHASLIGDITMKIEKAYEYEAHRPQNEISTKMWNILKDENKNLFGGFLKRWSSKEKLDPVFITEAKGQIAEAFDLIAELESKKIKETDQRIQKLISPN
jgi:hypothetical protein